MEPQSLQVGAISETPSTWLTLFALLRISPETCPTQFTGAPKLLIVTFLYEWLVLARVSQLPKSHQTSNSCFTLPKSSQTNKS